MTEPVNPELAKLLKEKGIKIDTDEVIFYRDEVNNIEKHQIKNRDVLYSYTGMELHPTFDDNEYQTYTIAEVTMWLYEKHGIWIVVNPHKGKNNLGEPFMEFDPEVWSFTNECVLHNTGLLYFNSPTEAYEAAIEYSLNNLI
jgi:hypothetical protein